MVTEPTFGGGLRISVRTPGAPGNLRHMTGDVAWEPLPDYEQFWMPFDARYQFTPSYQPPLRAIKEPLDSVTFSLAPIIGTGSEARFAAGVAALNSEVLRAFVEVFPDDERLVVLDWQHPSYWFRRHRQAIGNEAWAVSPFPDGDYYIFLTQNLSSGTFGHPWEETFCVFGQELVDVLAPCLGSWLPIVRHAGSPP